VRLDIRRIASIKQGQEVIGSRTRVRVVKNKVAPPFKEAEFDIIYGKGISREGDVLDLAADHNTIEKSGTWYSYRDQRIGQGRENAKAFLETNPEVYHQIEEEIMGRFNLKGRSREEEIKSGAE
jgi:recombination protein RecA